MKKMVVSLGFVGVLTLALGSACGSSDKTFEEITGDGGSSSGESSSGASGSSGTIGSSSGGAGDSGVLDQCATQTEQGKQLPLDILVMLDASGSMMETTGAGGTGPTKWASVKTALNGFINDAKSAGIGVGLQVFPIVHPGAPTTCTSSAQCTVGASNYGKCMVKVCSPLANTDPLKACDTDADCPGSTCRQFGQCKLGFVTSGNCLVGDPQYGSCLIGNCKALASATCDSAECFVADYSTAKVPIAQLPGNAAALTSTINTFADPDPSAMTPTAMAVQGGLAYAKQFAAANPGHVVVMVLATDGFPTRCAPLDIPGISALAAGGVSGTPSIKTFVIGVFSDAQKTQATTNLNQLATGGGTGSAFIVSTGANVTTQFQAALESIRGTALPCEYAVPSPESGTPDYDKLNVQFSQGGGAPAVLPYKKSASGCDAAGGWTYDTDPSTGGFPTKIILCPSTCDAVKKATGAKVEMVLGCKTVVQ